LLALATCSPDQVLNGRFERIRSIRSRRIPQVAGNFSFHAASSRDGTRIRESTDACPARERVDIAARQLAGAS
jgi:hypothetical protein